MKRRSKFNLRKLGFFVAFFVVVLSSVIAVWDDTSYEWLSRFLASYAISFTALPILLFLSFKVVLQEINAIQRKSIRYFSIFLGWFGIVFSISFLIIMPLQFVSEVNMIRNDLLISEVVTVENAFYVGGPARQEIKFKEVEDSFTFWFANEHFEEGDVFFIHYLEGSNNLLSAFLLD